MEEHLRTHTVNPSLLIEPIDEIIANSTVQMKVSADSIYPTEQVLTRPSLFTFQF